MSQIESHLEYLIPTDNILVFLLHSNLIYKSSRIDGFSIRLNGLPFIGPPCMAEICRKWPTFFCRANSVSPSRHIGQSFAVEYQMPHLFFTKISFSVCSIK